MTLLTLFRRTKPRERTIVLDSAVLGDAFKPARLRPVCVPPRPPAYRRTDSAHETLKAA